MYGNRSDALDHNNYNNSNNNHNNTWCYETQLRCMLTSLFSASVIVFNFESGFHRKANLLSCSIQHSAVCHKRVVLWFSTSFVFFDTVRTINCSHFLHLTELSNN